MDQGGGAKGGSDDYQSDAGADIVDPGMDDDQGQDDDGGLAG